MNLRRATAKAPGRRDDHRGEDSVTRTTSGLAGSLPTWAIVTVAVLVVAAIVVFAVRGSGTRLRAGSGVPAIDAASAQVVRDNSHRLSEAPGSKATFVAFLDFECGACRESYPVVEQLREEYAGRVTFVVRYFPVHSHINAMRAARAVEAAAQQGQLEVMYQRMYATQEEWGGKQVPADDTFRGYAVDLGLDLTTWDAVYNDNLTIDRVNLDVADGRALGVDSTPSFFVNGQRIQPGSLDDLSTALDVALTE